MHAKYSNDFWLNHFKTWKETGLTQTEYCRNNGIDQNYFSKKKIKMFQEEKRDETFIELKKTVKKSSIQLHVSGRYIIRLLNDFDINTLESLLEVLDKRI